MPWNLWVLCLRDHRIKCRIEQNWLLKDEKIGYRCFACQKIVSKYFYNLFWCTSCMKLCLSDRVLLLENYLKMSVMGSSCKTLHSQNGANAQHLAAFAEIGPTLKGPPKGP